jgi:4-amino-4-deoxy-L-arabinose transferase-like glycosyltransferase
MRGDATVSQLGGARRQIDGVSSPQMVLAAVAVRAGRRLAGVEPGAMVPGTVPAVAWRDRFSAVAVSGVGRARLAAGALLTLALILRVVYVLNTWRFIPLQDAHGYDWLGRGIANGHGWVMGHSAYRPPGYPVFLGVVYKIIGVPQSNYTSVTTHFGGWTGVRLVEAVLSTVTVGLIGCLALQLAGRRVALVTLAIAAVYVPLILVGVSLMTESLLVPLELAAVNCAVYYARAPRRGRKWLVLAGLFAGLCALTRGNGIVIGIALAFVVWTGRPRRSWRSLAAPAVLLGVMLLTISPWTIRNAIAQHAFVPVTTELGATLAGTYNHVAAKHDYIWTAGFRYSDYRALRHDHKLSEAQRNSRLTSAVLSYIGHHPSAVPEAMVWNTVRLFDLAGRHISRRSAAEDVGASSNMADLAVYTFWVTALLAIAGVLIGAGRRIPWSLWMVPVFLWLSEAPVTTGTPRFRAVLDPWFILLAGMGVAILARRVWSLFASQRPAARRGSLQTAA